MDPAGEEQHRVSARVPPHLRLTETQVCKPPRRPPLRSMCAGDPLLFLTPQFESFVLN